MEGKCKMARETMTVEKWFGTDLILTQLDLSLSLSLKRRAQAWFPSHERRPALLQHKQGKRTDFEEESKPGIEILPDRRDTKGALTCLYWLLEPSYLSTPKWDFGYSRIGQDTRQSDYLQSNQTKEDCIWSIEMIIECSDCPSLSHTGRPTTQARINSPV